MAFTEQLPPRLQARLDGSLVNREGVRVGRIVNSGREIETGRLDHRYMTVCHGWAILDLTGAECFWAPKWGDALVIAPEALARAARRAQVAA